MPAPSDALAYAKRAIGSTPIDDTDLKVRLLDDAHKQFWMADNWPWSVDTLVPVTLVNGTQDYALSSTPSDVAYLVAAKMWSQDANQTQTDLRVAAKLQNQPGWVGLPREVAYFVSSGGNIRVMPTPAGLAILPKIYSWYKKTPVSITAGNYTSDYTTTFLVPNYWFQVYQEIVLLKAYNFMRDQRAGSITFVNGQAQYTGQAGIVMAAINDVRMTEKKFLDNFGGEVHNNA